MKYKKFIKISTIIALIFLLVAAAALTSCKCLSCGNGEEAEVPIQVLAKADSFIISTTGKEFFGKYITADFFRTKHTTTKWLTSFLCLKNLT